MTIQVSIAFVVAMSAMAATSAGRSGGTDIVTAVENSGASIYTVSASNQFSGQPEAVDRDVLVALSAAENVRHVSASTTFETLVGVPGRANQRRVVLAATETFAEINQVVVSDGAGRALVWASNAGSVIIGPEAADQMGVRRDCFTIQTCELTVGRHTFGIAGLIEDSSLGLADAVVVDLGTATTLGLAQGATRVDVSAFGLPATRVRRSLDEIASAAGPQAIVVSAPTSAAGLRNDINTTWQRTIAALAILVLVVGAAAQTAVQRSIVRSRHLELATLRSIGYPPGFSLLVFLTESLILALTGALAALAISLAARTFAQEVGLPRFDIPTSTALAICAMAFVVAASASLLSSVSASLVSPAEAVRQG